VYFNRPISGNCVRNTLQKVVLQKREPLRGSFKNNVIVIRRIMPQVMFKNVK